MRANDAMLFSEGVGAEQVPSSFPVTEVVCIPVTLKTKEIEKDGRKQVNPFINMNHS